MIDSGVTRLAALELGGAGLKVAGLDAIDSKMAELDALTEETDESTRTGDDPTRAGEEASGELGTVSGITTGAEIGAVGAVVATVDATDATEDTDEEAEIESGITIGVEVDVEGAATVPEFGTIDASDDGGLGTELEAIGDGVPVMGEPIIEPDESSITVTGTTTTAVSEPDVMADEDELGSETTTGDSCLEVSTLEVN